MAPVIEADRLVKSYQVRQQSPGIKHALKALFKPEYVVRHALDEVSFSVEEGSITGLMGANGAGKSTLVKLLVGIMQRDGGGLKVAGLDPFRERESYVGRIGVVFGQRSNLLWDLSVAESFELHSAVFHVPPSEYAARLEELTEIFDLEQLLRQPVRTLSLGQTMRCAVAQVLLQRPDILFLDEPTIGLDVVSVELLGETLARLNKAFNTTIVMTSHDLSIIESICHQVILLNEGRVLFDGSSQQAMERYGRFRKLRFLFPAGADLSVAVNYLTDAGLEVTQGPSELIAMVDAETDVIGRYAALVDALTQRHGLLEFFMEKPSLKEVVLHAFQ